MNLSLPAGGWCTQRPARARPVSSPDTEAAAAGAWPERSSQVTENTGARDMDVTITVTSYVTMPDSDFVMTGLYF